MDIVRKEERRISEWPNILEAERLKSDEAMLVRFEELLDQEEKQPYNAGRIARMSLTLACCGLVCSFWVILISRGAIMADMLTLSVATAITATVASVLLSVRQLVSRFREVDHANHETNAVIWINFPDGSESHLKMPANEARILSQLHEKLTSAT